MMSVSFNLRTLVYAALLIGACEVDVDRTGLDDDEDGSVEEGDNEHGDHEDEDDHDEEEHPPTTRGRKGDAGTKHGDGGAHTGKSDAGARGHGDGGTHDLPGDARPDDELPAEGLSGSGNDLDAGLEHGDADAHVGHAPPAAGGSDPRPPTSTGAPAAGGTSPAGSGPRVGAPVQTPSPTDTTKPVVPPVSHARDAGSPAPLAPDRPAASSDRLPGAPASGSGMPPPSVPTQQDDHGAHEPDGSQGAPTPPSPTEPPSSATDPQPTTPPATDPSPSPPAADPCDGLTGPAKGLEFTGKYCTGCHSSAAPSAGVALDTEDIVSLASRIRGTVIDGVPIRMPFGAPPAAADVEALQQWLSCNEK